MPASFTSADLGDGIRALTLSHPARKNALDDQALQQLRAALADAAGVRCWVLRGDGDAFSAGYDLSTLVEVGETGPLPDDFIGDVFDLLAASPAPSIALVRGPAFGAGCELACACDFRVGDASSVFCLPPAKIGVVYAPRGIARVSSVVGKQRAKRMLLTGMRVSADEALGWGLLDVKADDAEAATLSLARELAAGAPLAVAGMRKIFGGGAGDFRAERRAAFNSADAREGREAFLQRRPPKFSGR